MRSLRLAVVGLGFLVAAQSLAASPEASGAARIEEPGLRSVAGWLRDSGVEGFLGADVADAMGIARSASEDAIQARQRGFRDEETLRMAQLVDRGELLLFMVQGPAEVAFYLSSVRGGLRKALLYIPARNQVVALEGLQAESEFQRELLYWESQVGR